MSLQIPNTTAPDDYTNAATFRSDADFVTGWILVANNPAVLQFLYGVHGQVTLGPEISTAPVVAPVNSPKGIPIKGIRFKNAVAGNAAQVQGALFTEKEPALGSGSAFTQNVSPSGLVGIGAGVVLARATRTTNLAVGSSEGAPQDFITPLPSFTLSAPTDVDFVFFAPAADASGVAGAFIAFSLWDANDRGRWGQCSILSTATPIEFALGTFVKRLSLAAGTYSDFRARVWGNGTIFAGTGAAATFPPAVLTAISA